MVAMIHVDGRMLRLSNLDKVLWPETGFTKGELIAYYRAVAPVLLPYLADRPLTLARFPDGVDGPGWYQTNCPPGRPEWLPIAEVPSRDGRVLRYTLVNEPAALVWVANLGTLELHPLLAPMAHRERADALVFDLDPGPPAGLLQCCELAVLLRDRLARAGLRSWAKTSGAKGLHLYVPLEGGARFDETKALARAWARELAAEYPERVTDRMAYAERTGKVFIDWGQNDPNKSVIAPYSLRATPRPQVSTPLRWEEVERAVQMQDVAQLSFRPTEVLERLERDGDLFRPVIKEWEG